MANAADQAVDLTPQKGVDLRSLSKQVGSPFIQNVLTRNGDMQVRPGYGLVREYGTTLNNGRTLASGFRNRTLGLSAPIGATAYRTPWGSDQIVAVHAVYGYSGNLATDDTYAQSTALGNILASDIFGLAVHVHDVTTNRHVEFVLHDQDVIGDDLMNYYPHYASRFDAPSLIGTPYRRDYTRWIRLTREPKWALFTPFEGALMIAIDGAGVWTYRGIDSPVAADRKSNSLDTTTSTANQAGEASALSPVRIGDGVLIAAEQTYLRPEEFGLPQAMGSYLSRMVYAVGNSLFFSDQYRPDAILTDNVEQAPSQDTITLVETVRGTLFVATARSCWAYQPPQGTVSLQGGTWTQLSGAVGCVSNQAWSLGDEAIFFVEDSGVYAYSGGVQIQHISAEVDRWWTDPTSLQMALTDYYTASGLSALSSVQLPARIDIRQETERCRAHWNQERGMLLLAMPSVTLCWTQGFGWQIWYFATHAGQTGEVAGLSNITGAIHVSVQDRLFLLGGADTGEFTDTTVPEAVEQSCYLLEFGRGGALDRSSCIDPAVAKAYELTLSGLWVENDVLRVTINAVNYNTTMTAAAAAAADPLAALAALAETTVGANPFFVVTATSTGLRFVASAPGVLAQIVTATVPVGTGTATVALVADGVDADASEGPLEDQRQPVGGWVRFGDFPTSLTQASLWVGQPVKLPAGYKPRSGQTITTESAWFPLLLGHWAGGGAAPIQAIEFWFEFDNTQWEAITLSDVDPEVDFVLPSRRLGSLDGYAPGAMDAVRQLRVFGGGGPDPAGNQIRLNFDATAAPPGSWTTWPELNTSNQGPDPLVWIGFRYIGVDSSLQIVSTVTSAKAESASPPTVDVPVYVWQQGLYPSAHVDLGDLRQPVDWAVKTVEAESKGLQVRARGVYLTAMHFGAGTNQATRFWQYGPLNTATSSEMRDYSGQAVDFFSTPPGNSEQNNIAPRKRLQTVTGTAPNLKTFNNIARWSDTGDPDKGNLLIDDQQVDVLATTDGTQGTKVSVMVHGTMNAPGDGLRLGRVEVAMRVMGGRRRWH